MKGLIMMLRALGIQITEADAEALSAVIPTIPARLNQAADAIEKAINNFDERLRAIEEKLSRCVTVPKE